MDLLQLRTQLETLAVEDLGLYTLPNGVQTPAFSVRSPGERLPIGTTVTGLELILIRNPDLTPIPQYADQAALRKWTLFLVNWDQAANMEDVAAKIIATYPGTTSRPVLVPKGAGPTHQLRLELQVNPTRLVCCNEEEQP